jgi:hypothetical protein
VHQLNFLHHEPARWLAIMAVVAALLVLPLAANADSSSESSPTAINPDFKAYDMSGLSWLPPQLVEKGYETIPVLFMCHMWNPRFGSEPTNCDNADFSKVNHEVVRQRAREMRGEPVVVIDIERGRNPTSEVWHILSEEPEVTERSMELWQEMIAVFREENTESEIMIYKPIQRIWWPMIQNRQVPLLKRGQASIDVRYRNAEQIAPLFEDKSLFAWPSAYVDRDEPEIYREERQWQIDICKNLYKTRCIFAMTPFYVKTRDENNQPIPVDADWFYQILRELEEDGADGFGVWLPRAYDNERYLGLVRDWAAGDKPVDPRVQWLGAIDRFLSERKAAKSR